MWSSDQGSPLPMYRMTSGSEAIGRKSTQSSGSHSAITSLLVSSSIRHSATSGRSKIGTFCCLVHSSPPDYPTVSNSEGDDHRNGEDRHWGEMCRQIRLSRCAILDSNQGLECKPQAAPDRQSHHKACRIHAKRPSCDGKHFERGRRGEQARHDHGDKVVALEPVPGARHFVVGPFSAENTPSATRHAVDQKGSQYRAGRGFEG